MSKERVCCVCPDNDSESGKCTTCGLEKLCPTCWNNGVSNKGGCSKCGRVLGQKPVGTDKSDLDELQTLEEALWEEEFMEDMDSMIDWHEPWFPATPCDYFECEKNYAEGRLREEPKKSENKSLGELLRSQLRRVDDQE